MIAGSHIYKTIFFFFFFFFFFRINSITFYFSRLQLRNPTDLEKWCYFTTSLLIVEFFLRQRLNLHWIEIELHWNSTFWWRHVRIPLIRCYQKFDYSAPLLSRVDTDVLMEVAYSCNFLAVSDSSACPDIGTSWCHPGIIEHFEIRGFKMTP